MTLIRPSLDYTDKDFDAVRARLFNIIPSAFPDWTDYQIANFGNLLVEMTAFVSDVLTYYQDNQAAESRWTSAQLKRSMLSLLKLISYAPTGASAATAKVALQLSASPAGSVTFNVGDTFQTLESTNPVSFQLLKQATIPAAADPPVVFVDVENSTPARDTFFSTALPNQSYTLQETPFLDGSLVITANDGVYTIVDDFLSSTSTSRHALLQVDENSRANITFGNGVAGSVPTGTITCVYKTGGGTVGNVSPNTITRVNGSYTDNLGNPVTVKVTNTARASGGANAMTIEAIRESAPRSLRAPSRTVCREDYEIQALRVPGVARALMLARDELATIQENQGNLYLVPQGGGPATGALMNAVAAMITERYPKTITFKLNVFSATYLPVNVVTRIHLAKGAVGSVVAANVRQVLYDFFSIKAADGSSNLQIDFGYYLDGAIAWSDVFNVIRDTRGVRKVDDGLGNLTLNNRNSDLTVPLQMFPVIGSIVVIDAATGAGL